MYVVVLFPRQTDPAGPAPQQEIENDSYQEDEQEQQTEVRETNWIDTKMRYLSPILHFSIDRSKKSYLVVIVKLKLIAMAMTVSFISERIARLNVGLINKTERKKSVKQSMTVILKNFFVIIFNPVNLVKDNVNLFIA